MVTLIIIGATGDLSRRKLIPALYALLRKQAPIGLIVGTGRESFSAGEILERARPFFPAQDEEAWQHLQSLFYYQPLDFAQPEGFTLLEQFITQKQQAHGFAKAPRIAYLAIAADHFCTVTEQLLQAGTLISYDTGYKIVYEKPFGWDLASARAINACIKRFLSETQVYRIDHYLAKDFVGNILLMRSANTLFKAIWNNSAIEAVKIFFYETVGIEGRGAFYDRYGALKDVVQNHMLQILALVALNDPTAFTAEALRDKKAELLHAIRVITGVLGQYEGYLQEPGVAPESRTETYAALKLFIDHPTWYGVPFYLETGKQLARKSTEVHIILKPVAHCPWSSSGQCSPNLLIIRITPQEGFSLHIVTKKPGTASETVTVPLNFTYASIFGPISSEAYELLVSEIIAGNQAATVRFDEIEYQWEVIEKIYELQLPLFSYPQGSDGPREAFILMHERDV